MSEHMKCKVCGKVFYSAELFGGANLFKESICPDCKRARAFNGGGKKGGFSGGNSNAAEEAARREEQKRKAAAHKDAIRNIKNFEFPDDDNEFIRAVNTFCDDYCDCHPGLFADGSYKKAYKIGAERELKILKDSNPEHYEKFKETWNDAVATMKKKRKTRIIITGSLAGAGAIVGLILGAGSRDVGPVMGLITGMIVGGVLIGIWPHLSTDFSKSKEDDE